MTLADLEAGLRVVLAAPPERRRRAAACLVADADLADRYRQASGKNHPLWGAGTLISAAARHPWAPRQSGLDDEALETLTLLIGAIRHHGLR